MEEPATVVYVAFATTGLDTAWIPPHAPVIVVHNDDHLALDAVTHPQTRHLVAPGNIGFGAAVNLALAEVTTARTILCNPDVGLTADHWAALAGGEPDEVVTVPLLDARGVRTWVVAPYPGPLEVLATAYRLGGLLGRENPLRLRLSSLLGPGRRQPYASLLFADTGSWPLGDVWASGAVLSADTQRLRDVGGFDPAYFLYMEDLDLCRRLAARFPAMRVRLAPTPAGVHTVGAASSGARPATARHRLASVRTYCARQSSPGWRLAGLAIAPRAALLSVRARRVAAGVPGGASGPA